MKVEAETGVVSISQECLEPPELEMQEGPSRKPPEALQNLDFRHLSSRAMREDPQSWSSVREAPGHSYSEENGDMRESLFMHTVGEGH